MEDLERINQVEKLLVDSKEIMKTIDEMFYKKKYNEIEKFKSFVETDKKFRICRNLLLKNMKDLKECLDTNFNLFLALQIHMKVMINEIQKIDEQDTDQIVKEEDERTIYIDSSESDSSESDSSESDSSESDSSESE